MARKTVSTGNIRWLIRRDMPDVIEIEEDVFECPWLEDDFVRVLRQRNCIGMCYDLGEHICAFMMYELNKTKISVINFAVARDRWRSGIGTAMTQKMISKLSCHRRTRIELCVRESDSRAQLFWSAMGFRAIKLLQGHYEDNGEDGYQFEYRVDGWPEVQPCASQKKTEVLAFTNRITDQFRPK